MVNTAALANMKKDELVELCKQNGITGYSKLKKDELIALLSETLSAPAEKADAAPVEEKKAPAKKKCCKKAKAPESELSRYCTALVNLWGIAPIPMVAAVYNQYKNASVTAEEVEAAASCPVVDGELIHKDLIGKDNEIKALRKKQEHYHHYVPTPTHVEDYLDENYRENTHEFGAMRDFMMRSFDMKEEEARTNTMRILKYLDDQSDISRLMGELAGTGMRFENDQQFHSFAVLMDKMKSASRFWGFCGHTPVEAANYNPKKGTVHVYKVGRNDPCPCGSGKKYKKCCGR